MKKILLGLTLLCSFFAAVAQKEIVNDPNAEMRSINGSFTKIIISGGIDLYLSQSQEEAVAVSAAQDRFKEGIKTVVENNTLRIYYFADKAFDVFKNKKLRVYVSFKNLESVEASGACDVQVAGVITVPTLALSMSGASDFKGAVKVSSLKMDLSGASDVTIKGIANTVDVESSGASDVSGYELSADVCNARASGASDINITVNKTLNASASGSSDIRYKGEGVLKDAHTSGSSSVSKKG